MDQDMNKDKDARAWGADKTNDQNTQTGKAGSNREMEMNSGDRNSGESGSMGNDKGMNEGKNEMQYSGTQARASAGADESATSEMDSSLDSGRENEYSERNESDGVTI